MTTRNRRTPPPYPLAHEPGVHVILSPLPDGYGDAVHLATEVVARAAQAWDRVAREREAVEAQVWRRGIPRHASWSRDAGVRTWTGPAR